MSVEYQHEHRTLLWPMRAMFSSGQRDPALRTLVPLVPHHQVDNSMLPMLSCEIRVGILLPEEIL